jgi:hypothetical protein
MRELTLATPETEQWDHQSLVKGTLKEGTRVIRRWMRSGNSPYPVPRGNSPDPFQGTEQFSAGLGQFSMWTPVPRHFWPSRHHLGPGCCPQVCVLGRGTGRMVPL